jgi:hypothetical protein
MAIVEQPLDKFLFFNAANFEAGQRFLDRPHLLFVANRNRFKPAISGHVNSPNDVLAFVHPFFRIFVVETHFLIY